MFNCFQFISKLLTLVVRCPASRSIDLEPNEDGSSAVFTPGDECDASDDVNNENLEPAASTTGVEESMAALTVYESTPRKPKVLPPSRKTPSRRCKKA